MGSASNRRLTPPRAPFGPRRAARPDRASPELRPLRLAQLAAVLDQVDVGLVHLLRVKHAQKQVVGVVRADPGADEADAVGDPLDVPIDRHQRQPERKSSRTDAVFFLPIPSIAVSQSRASSADISPRNSKVADVPSYQPRRSAAGVDRAVSNGGPVRADAQRARAREPLWGVTSWLATR